MVTTIKLGSLNVLVRTHSFITRYIKPLFRKARKSYYQFKLYFFMKQQKNLQGQVMTKGKTIKHKEKVAFAQSKACKAFAIVLNTDGKYVIVMGDYQLSKKTFDKIKQAEEFITKKPYELIINAAFAAANFIINQQNKQNNDNTNKENAN